MIYSLNGISPKNAIENSKIEIVGGIYGGLRKSI
jgi:hypothetical protein